MKIYSIGIGPGDSQYLTPQAKEILRSVEVVIGYTYYIELIQEFLDGKVVIDTGMKKEQERVAKAFELAEEKEVAIISSGDSGVYGMASLLWETKKRWNSAVEIEVIPGISAMFAASAQFGAPFGHDFCAISLSDLLTPWENIERKIVAAAQSDFVTAVYNPSSKNRFWQLMRFKDIFLEYRSADTPVGIARQVGRDKEENDVTTLEDLRSTMVDMFSIVIVGNSQTEEFEGKLITPRGYYADDKPDNSNIGRNIMKESFKKILPEIESENKSIEHKWLALHCIHTTADFSLNDHIGINGNIVSLLHSALHSGNPPKIITDVSMVKEGIRKTIVEKLGIEIKCYLKDPRVRDLAEKQNITRTQAGIRLAVKEHPEGLFVFGNAPTALIELIRQIKSGNAYPTGVIAAPVGFVNVKESKWQMKYGCPDIPSVIIEGNKGGSSIAATIVNAILSWKDAEQINPGNGI